LWSEVGPIAWKELFLVRNETGPIGVRRTLVLQRRVGRGIEDPSADVEIVTAGRKSRLEREK